MSSKVKLVAKTMPVGTTATTLGEYIAYVARVSNPRNQHNNGSAPRLLRYLARHAHWSPFEMAHLTMEIATTRDISHQIMRHRSFAYQEWSGRYSAMPAEPSLRAARMQDKDNRQSSLPCESPALDDWWNGAQSRSWQACYARYKEALEAGIAKEVARAVLPEGLVQTTLYMTGSVRSWIHYCQVRCGEDTQLEHRRVALAVRDILLAELPELAGILAEG